MASQEKPFDYVEPLLTLREAARQLALPAFKLRRAATNGAFLTYTLSNSRKLVRLSEVVTAIERTASGRGNQP